MIRDYGYIEDGKLGKPYNLRLLSRLIKYMQPYRTRIFLALLFSVIITVSDLSVPYFSKVAIDRFIMPYWQKIAITPQVNGLLRKYRLTLPLSKNGKFYVLSDTDLKRIDPKDLYKYKKAGIISKEKFYLISPGTDTSNLPGTLRQSANAMKDGSILIPLSDLRQLPYKTIGAIRQSDLRGLGTVGLILAVLILVSFSLGFLEYYLLEFIGQHVMQDIRIELFANIQAQSVSFFAKHPVGRLVTRVTNDVENLNEMFKSVVITLFKDFSVITGILAVLFYMNWSLALVCIMLIPVISFFTFLFSSMARDAFRELRAKVAKINAFLGERLSGVYIIQLFCAEQAQEKQFQKINHENFLAGMKQIRIFAIFMPLMELLSALGVALIVWYGGGKVIQDRLTLGALVAFISYIQMFFKPIRDISEKYNIMQSAMASIERIFQFMDYRETLPETNRPVIPEVISGHLLADNVTFSYDGGEPVLRNVSLELKSGQTLAVVGHTGSGKTTLANLLLRMYDPDTGMIYLDGLELQNWPTPLLRKLMAPVMQEVFVFSGTIRENITLGRDTISSQDLEEVLKITNLDSLIARLPNGIDHAIGEGGANLSAGQRQLLSFARALAGKPKVLILDEATSSVDPETEALIRDATEKIAMHQTTLIIAHRLTTVKDADNILVLHRGRVVEQGSHDELIAMGGVYYRLHRLQQQTTY